MMLLITANQAIETLNLQQNKIVLLEYTVFVRSQNQLS
jgi:hypothetical protein